MNLRINLLIILLLGLILNSCSMVEGENNPSSPPIQFDEQYLNQQIQLIAEPNLNSFKVDDFVGILLRYNTDNEITFPDNYNLRLFIIQDGQWVEVYEKPAIRSGNKIVLSPEVPLSYGRIVSFFPDLDDVSKKYQMRAYIFGDMDTREGIIQVAAYTDFVLRP